MAAANKMLGEVGFKALGQDLVFRLDFSALCELEDVAPDLMDRGAATLGPRGLREVLKRGLKDKSGEFADESVGLILDEIGVLAFYRIFRDATEPTWAKVPPELALKKTGAPADP